MKIGVRGHDIGIQDNISSLAERTKQIGFDYIQLVPKKILRNESSNLSDELVEQINSEFNKHKLEIALLGAYFNPIHSNAAKVQADIEEFKLYLKYANKLGSLYVGTETGSYNDDLWTYNPKNHTNEAYEKVLTVVKELVNEAKKFNSFVAIEPAYNHVIYNENTLKRLIEDVNSPNMVIIIDIYNLLSIDNYQDYKAIFATFLNLFKEKIKIFHFKDFVVENNELVRVGLGEGYIDFEYIIELINEHLPEAYVIFEGVPEDKLDSSLSHINTIYKKYINK